MSDVELAVAYRWDNLVQQLQYELFLCRTRNALHTRGIYGAIEFVQSQDIESHLTQVKNDMLEKLEKLKIQLETARASYEQN